MESGYGSYASYGYLETWDYNHFVRECTGLVTCTPLHSAVIGQSLEVVQLLLDHSAELTTFKRSGGGFRSPPHDTILSPIQLAERYGTPDIVDLLRRV